MIETLTALWHTVAQAMTNQFNKLVGAPFNPNERVFWLYFLVTGVLAYVLYRTRTLRAGTEPVTLRGFGRFLFPRHVWANKSAWLDVRYFIVNHFIGKFFYLGLTAFAANLVFQLMTGQPNLGTQLANAGLPTWSDMGIAVIYMLVAMGLADFTAYVIHYLQHKVPFLWEFHKVHHSPEVMHPLSNFREHPIDNIVYTASIGATFGLVMSLAFNWLGYMPNVIALMGAPLLSVLFNLGGYHLRHSHIWLRWPGKWSMVFPSPAHHHVHHSCHPDHLDKNFAFMLPLWDVIFRTYHMPETNKDVKFGVYGVETPEYDTIAKIYLLPLRKTWDRMTGTKKPAAEAAGTPETRLETQA